MDGLGTTLGRLPENLKLACLVLFCTRLILGSPRLESLRLIIGVTDLSGQQPRPTAR